MSQPARRISVVGMASSSDQPVGAGRSAGQPPARHHRPWGWIVCVLLVLIAGGLAIWTLELQSDLDD
jgi:hypothetical protein